MAKVAADGSGLVYAGYIGGSGEDYGDDIAVDGTGAAYVTGLTSSTEAAFPVQGGPDLTHNGGYLDAFLAKVAADGSGLVYAGYIGGDEDDFGNSIIVDGEGAAYVTGWTWSTEATFLVQSGPDLTYNGGGDAFVAKVAADGSGLVYAGYIGGKYRDEGYGIAVDGEGAACVTGQTESTKATFPVQIGPDPTYNGGYNGDAFVAKINISPISLPPGALIAPKGATADNTPIYQWNAVSGTTKYHLKVLDSTGAMKISKWYTADQAGCDAGEGTCAVTPVRVLAEGGYKWWIRTWGSTGYGPWSQAMSFTVATIPPLVATLIAPEGTITDSTPTYQWNAVANAAEYHLRVKDSAGTMQISKWYTAARAGCARGAGTCAVNPVTVLAEGGYKCQIQTWNATGYGRWSAPLAFEVLNP